MFILIKKKKRGEFSRSLTQHAGSTTTVDNILTMTELRVVRRKKRFVGNIINHIHYTVLYSI